MPLELLDGELLPERQFDLFAHAHPCAGAGGRRGLRGAGLAGETLHEHGFLSAPLVEAKSAAELLEPVAGTIGEEGRSLMRTSWRSATVVSSSRERRSMSWRLVGIGGQCLSPHRR